MKKGVITFAVLALVFFAGILTGKSNFKSRPPAVNHEVAAVDSAQLLFEKEWEEKYPIYAVQGGLPDPEDKYRRMVSLWYGFRFTVTGGGCTNSTEPDSRINAKTGNIMKKKMGNDWYQRFEKTADSLYGLDTLAVDIAENDAAVKKLIRKKSKGRTNNFYPRYKCYPCPQKNLKVVSIGWNGLVYRDTSVVSFIRAVVDIKKKKVTKIEDAEMEWDPYF